MTLFDLAGELPPRPEEEIADAEGAYRLIQLPAHPAEFMVIFPGGDTETLACHEGAVTGFERWEHWVSSEMIHEIVRELRGVC